MDIAVHLLDLTAMHPRLLWADIVAATVAVLSETHPHSPFPFVLIVQDLPGFGSAELQLAIDPFGIAPDHVNRLRRTYPSSRLVELAAIAIAGLDCIMGVDTKYGMLLCVGVEQTIWWMHRTTCWKWPVDRGGGTLRQRGSNAGNA
jgi:hypothetical protein